MGPLGAVVMSAAPGTPLSVPLGVVASLQPQAVSPAPAAQASPTTVPSDQSQIVNVQPPTPVVAAPVNQGALAQVDALDGLGGNADVNVAPIDNSVTPDPSTNSGDQPQS